MQLVSIPRQHILHTSFFCIITIELFSPASLCHLTFFTLTHTVCHSGALNTCFLLFVTLAICLCPALLQVIFLYVTIILFTLVYVILFCQVRIHYVSISMIAGAVCLFQELVHAICLQWHQHHHVLSAFYDLELQNKQHKLTYLKKVYQQKLPQYVYRQHMLLG